MNGIVRAFSLPGIGFLLAASLGAGCASGPSEDNRDVVRIGTAARNTPDQGSAKYQDPQAVSALDTANVESNDILNCANYLVGRMLANPLITHAETPRHVIVDSAYFTVNTSTRFDKDVLINNLRVALIQAANGRIRFVGRQYAAIAEEEKDLQAGGVVGPGTTPGSATQLGADYRLAGSVREMAENAGGVLQKYTLMTFEMVDTKTNEIVFSDKWDFKKQQTTPRAYR